MEKLALIHGECGHRMWVEARFLEQGLAALVFFDVEETSETYAERIGHCPECGKRPIEHLLNAQRALLW